MGIMVRGREPERERRRVEVIHSTSTEGVVTPLCVVWDDGRRFPVERVLERRPARSLKTGGQGVRYTVRVGQVVTDAPLVGRHVLVCGRQSARLRRGLGVLRCGSQPTVLRTAYSPCPTTRCTALDDTLARLEATVEEVFRFKNE